MYKEIIWNFDGTLFDTYPNMVYAFQRALKDDGIEENDEEILSHMKVSITHTIDFYKTKHKISDEMIMRFCNYEKETNEELIKPFLNVKEICRDIYYSGKRNYLFTHRGKSALGYLKYHNLYGYFNDFITSDDGFRKKPNPEAILHLVKKYKIKTDEILMIGDRDIDIIAARNAGVKSCLFDPDSTQNIDIADYSVKSIEQLYQMIEL
ncbi:HAD-superfamily hydrolase, subfamily IA, variant 1 [Clostridium putrefaciens]|uniref:HAD-superfamily hydrolase, subfamily IA, variant 1 n=1 Tax=Clostridium putrefaciens TaxID=99675 RepID=A0A381J8W6_9CLOT|nr:HAD-IA family hydrolase [Clostridium putrefaciens]SUY46876.1 HAD-superfamily hydrolase, subfamily IA, variant 1 [Clostridium putrefaciens]